MLALVIAVASLALEGPHAPLTKPAQRELQELLTRIVAEPDPEKRKARCAEGARLEQDHALSALVAVLRAGPAAPPAHDVERIVAGEKEKLERFGRVFTGYTFVADGDRYRYAVDVPQQYHPAEPRALLIDPGHVTGARHDAQGKAGFLDMYRRHADESGHRDWLVARTEIIEQIGGDGLRGEKPEDVVAAVFGAFLRDVTTRFAVDLDRIYVTGLSQTGFWSWYLARERADRFAGIAPMGAVTWEVDHVLENLLLVPVFVLQGAHDPTVQAGPPRSTSAALARLGGTVRYLEIATAAHDYGVWGRQPEALKWLGERPRVRYPRRVSKSVGTLHNPWAYWLRVDALEKTSDGGAKAPPTAGIDGEVDGQTIRLFSTGIKAVTVALSSELVDLAAPVAVDWNGKRVFEGQAIASFATALEIAGEKGDWLATFEALIEARAP